MRSVSAIVFIPDDTAREGLDQPLMLQTVLFCPVAAWVAQGLSAVGVERFFLVCHDKYTEAAVSCFPEGAALIRTNGEPGTWNIVEAVWLMLTLQSEIRSFNTMPI